MPPNRTIPRTCVACGDHFLAVAHDVKRGKGLFCGYSCSNGSRIPPTFKTCPVCNTAFRAKPNARQICCSLMCREAAKAAKILAGFWDTVDRGTGCWDYTKNPDRNGYGRFSAGGQTIYASHHAWQLASRSPVPEGFMICHVCDHPPCIRNDDAGTYEVDGVIRPRFGHLWIGTQIDNMRDMSNKGRSFAHVHPELVPKGQAAQGARLTEDAVRAIRAVKEWPWGMNEKIARQYGVNSGTIHHVRSGKTWRHVQ